MSMILGNEDKRLVFNQRNTDNPGFNTDQIVYDLRISSSQASISIMLVMLISDPTSLGFGESKVRKFQLWSDKEEKNKI